MKFDIYERCKKFAVRIVKIVGRLPQDTAGRAIGGQLIRSGTSIGANLQEADAASSRKDFFHKISLSYKEAKETRYWLDLIIDSGIINNTSCLEEVHLLSREALELSKILFSIMKNRE